MSAQRQNQSRAEGWKARRAAFASVRLQGFMIGRSVAFFGVRRNAAGAVGIFQKYFGGFCMTHTLGFRQNPKEPDEIS
jgi:hypothetical protein